MSSTYQRSLRVGIVIFRLFIKSADFFLKMPLYSFHFKIVFNSTQQVIEECSFFDEI